MKNYSSFTKNLVLAITTIVILSGLVIKYQQQAFYYYDHKDNSNNIAYNNADYKKEIGTPQNNRKDIGINLATITSQINSLKVDQRKVNKVHGFLLSRGSPLASKAEFLVKTSDKFKIDYRLVAAISIVESSGGKYTYRPYNAWGWGGAVNPFTFTSWEDSIYTVTKGLAGYYSGGLVTPKQIAPRYNPHTPNQWSGKVQYIMDQIANY